MGNEKKKFELNSQKIAVTAMYVAVLLLLDRLPYIGYIPPLPPFTTAKITFLPIVIILAAQNDGLFTGIVCGAIWGLLSLVGAATNYINFGLTPYLLNPLISILPRICIGVTAHYVFKALKKFNFWAASIISALVGVVTNTALVLGMFLLFTIGKQIPLSDTESIASFSYALGLITINFLIELGACLIVVPAGTFALHKSRKRPIGKLHTQTEPAPQPKTEDNDASRN